MKDPAGRAPYLREIEGRTPFFRLPVSVRLSRTKSRRGPGQDIMWPPQRMGPRHPQERTIALRHIWHEPPDDTRTPNLLTTYLHDAFDVDLVHDYRGHPLPGPRHAPQPSFRPSHPRTPKFPYQEARATEGSNPWPRERNSVATHCQNRCLGTWAPPGEKTLQCERLFSRPMGTLLTRSGGGGRGHRRFESPPHLVRCFCVSHPPQFRHKTVKNNRVLWI